MDIARRPSQLPAPAASRDTVLALDLALEASRSALAAAALVARGAGAVGRPVLRVVLRPPVVSPAHSPDAWLRALSRRGGKHRAEALRSLATLLDTLVPAVVEVVLSRVDLTEAVRRYVDLDRVVSDVDLDAAVARVDLDAAVARVDLDAAVARVDLDAAVAGVDVDAVARRLDLESVIAQLDLTRIVREHVDLDGLVATVDLDAAAARLDVSAVVDRVDVVGIAEDVIARVDLPEIIRESTGSMASDTLREVRMQSISGDEAVTRAMERLRLRRRRRGTPADDGAGPGDRVPPQPDRIAPREP